MIKFEIEDVSLHIDENFNEYDKFKVKSVPKDYGVFWNNNNPIDMITHEYHDGDVILMDKHLYDLYPIKDKVTYVVEATEDNKSIESILKFIEFLSSNNFNKGNKLIVVGGGITQDIGAFVGAVYKRGIDWVLFPSTLLSMCDSCIGGKTGINHKDVKNQLALFSSPSKVIICSQFINTLSEYDIKSGLGEILKLFITGGEYFVKKYSEYVKDGKVISKDYYKFLIFGALFIKRVIVEYDEFELDIRKSLNYGHTIGHAVESLSNYKIPHGQAVAVGMLVVNRMWKDWPDNLIESLCLDLIDRDVLMNIDYSNIKSLISKDKKTIGNETTFVFCDGFGGTFFEKINVTDKVADSIVDVIVQYADKGSSYE